MRVYFAGSASNRRYIKSQWIEPAKKAGYTITFDWTSENTSNPEELSRKCIDGVVSSNLVVGIMNKTFTEKHAYRGTFFELGLAWGWGVPIVILVNPEMVKFPPSTGAPTMIWAPGVRRMQTTGEVWSAMEQESVKQATRLEKRFASMGGCHQGGYTFGTSLLGKERPPSDTPLVPPKEVYSPLAHTPQEPKTRGKL